MIGHGIDVYYGKNDYGNIILFSDGKNICYHAGRMLIEMVREETKYLLTEKLKNMIRAFPDYTTVLNVESITDAVRWLYDTVESEDLPIATEIFRSCYSEIVKMMLEDEKTVIEGMCIGDFLINSYQKFSEYMGMFWFGVDSIATVNSNIKDSLSDEMVALIKKDADEVYPVWGKKCSSRRVKKTEEYEIREWMTFNIKMPIQILEFEYCRMRKTGNLLKKCANCGRYFMVKNRKKIFCNNPSPQNPDRSCKEIGPQIRRQRKRETDMIEKQYHRDYTNKAMAAKRARDMGECDKHFYNEMRRLSEEHKKTKKELRTKDEKQFK